MEWLLLLWALLRGNRTQASAPSAPAPAASASVRTVATEATPKKKPEVAVKAATQPAPWPVSPQAVASLPPFPGAGWVPDVPSRAAVVARAVQLIAPLHKAGRHTIELVEGRWIAFAPKMHGTKKAVEAFRRQTTVTPVVPLAQTRPSVPIQPVVMASPVTVAPPTAAPPVVSPPAPSAPAVRSASIAPPTLRRGSQGPDVVTVQRLVGAEPDGKFGPKTEQAVRSYQSANGLQSDGVVGPKTWASLLGAK